MGWGRASPNIVYDAATIVNNTWHRYTAGCRSGDIAFETFVPRCDRLPNGLSI